MSRKRRPQAKATKQSRLQDIRKWLTVYGRRPLGFEYLEARRMLSLTNIALSASQQTALHNGLQGWATWANTLDQYGMLAQQLPVIDQSIGSALNVSSLLQNQLVIPLLNNLSSSSTVVAALQGLIYSGNGLSVTVSSVSGGEVTPQGNEVQFNVVFDATRTTTTALDLGSNASADGLSFNGSANVQLTTTLAFNLTFGLELQPNLAPSDAFFIRDNSLTVGASAHLANANLTGQVGFLGVGVQGGSLNLNASLGVTFNPPDLSAANNITLTDFENYTPAQMVTLTPTSSSLTGTLPVTATLGSWTALGSPTITVNSANIFSGAAPAISLNTAFGPLLDFNRLTSGDFSSIFQQLGTSLNAAAPKLDAPVALPFLNEQLSQLANFSTLASTLSNGVSPQSIVGQASAGQRPA